MFDDPGDPIGSNPESGTTGLPGENQELPDPVENQESLESLQNKLESLQSVYSELQTDIVNLNQVRADLVQAIQAGENNNSDNTYIMASYRIAEKQSDGSYKLTSVTRLVYLDQLDGILLGILNTANSINVEINELENAIAST